jgi:DNA-binding NtrC family response regulator
MPEAKMARVLLVDDEPNILQVLACMLRSKKHDVKFTTEGQKAIDMAKAEKFDLLISDIRMNPVDGMTVLKSVRKVRPEMPVLMLTAYGSLDTAKQAIDLGAFGYVLKPFNLQELLITVDRALTYKTQRKGDAAGGAKPVSEYDLQDIVGESACMKAVRDSIRRIAAVDTPVLISGERGTGKNLVAKALHALSARKKGKFLTINCATLPEPLLELELFGYVKGAFASATSAKAGVLEMASGGTVLFDEIGWMPRNLQRKLHAAILQKGIRRMGGNENIPMDIRIIATSITPSGRLVDEGNVTEETYALLRSNVIEIKDLKDRPEDIMPLVRHFLLSEGGGKKQYMISSEAETILTAYQWPENVRELENAIKQAAKMSISNQITRESLPKEVAPV